MTVDRAAPYGTFCQLLRALQNARNRLSVAMAAEGKKTTIEKWNAYIETGHRVSRCLRQLRCGAVDSEASQRWRHAMDILRAAPEPDGGGSEASRVCAQLGKVLAVLEHDREP